MIVALFSISGLVSIASLVVMEIVLGVDNIIFISLICSELSVDKADKARKTGLSLALFFRILLLLGITWLIGFNKPLFHLLGNDLSARNLIMLGGGIFLLYKSTVEIHEKIEGENEQ